MRKALLVLAVAACDGTVPTSAPLEIGAALAEFHDDLVLDEAPVAAAGGVEPKVIYMWWADGGPAPSKSVCNNTPPKYECKFGTSLEDCQKKVQAYLDKYYLDFNLVFTMTKPTSGSYYTSIQTSAGGAWCGYDRSVGGVAPFNAMCTGYPANTSYAFLCGDKARDCAIMIAQEHAHVVGLEHTNSNADIMSPVLCTACAGFENKDLSLPYGICHKMQNSYQEMKSRLGAWPTGTEKPGPFGPVGGMCTDANAPTLMITEPADRAKVSGTSFWVRADATDDCSLTRVAIDIQPANLQAEATVEPFQWPIKSLDGVHTIKLLAEDASGKKTEQVITVFAGSANPGDGGAGGGSGGGGGMGGGAAGEGGGGCSTGGARDAGGGIVLFAAAAFFHARRRRRR